MSDRTTDAPRPAQPRKAHAMNLSEINNYLSHALPDATEDQISEMQAAAEVLARVFPGDDNDAHTEAFNAAVQVIMGDSVTAELVEAWKAANREVARCLPAMRGALVVEVARSNESAVSERYQVSRPTVRKAVGK